MLATFDDFEFDTSAFELRRAGEAIAVEPIVLDVLYCLLRNAGQLVTKEQLMSEVWGDNFVSESALSTRIKLIRRLLGDDGRTQRCIKTVHGRGYRFVLAVEWFDDGKPIVGDPFPVRPQAGPAGGPPAAEDVDGPLHNLPVDRTPLVGRLDDIESCRERLSANRLVSLVGIGGTGKTRLAAAVGASLVDIMDDGVWFVDLVPVLDGDGIDIAVANAIGLAVTEGDVRYQVIRFVERRRLVLILDNAEHLVEAVARFADDLLSRTIGPRLLVTSRVALGLVDESPVPLAPLPVGDELDSPAVELFLASAARVGVAIDDEQLPAVVAICRRLDGLPLAIELAAAQLLHLTIGELDERLDRRFELLAARGRGAGSRHGSLSAVLDDTWALLDPVDAELAAQLAVFPGTFGLSDAEQLLAVGGRTESATAGLAELVKRALVVRLEPDPRRLSRYRMLETVRLFAKEAQPADRWDELSMYHARWCLDRLGDSVMDHYQRFDTATWVLGHHDDLRTATRTLLDAGRVVDVARLVAAQGLGMHLDLGSRAAYALTLIDDLIDRLDDRTLIAELHLAGVMCGMATRSPRRIAEHGRLAVEAARQTDRGSLLAVSLILGSWSVVIVDPAAAIDMVSEAAAVAMAADDPTDRDLADAYRAFHLAATRDWDQALDLAREVFARSNDGDRLYSRFSAAVAVAAVSVLDDPAGAAKMVETVKATDAGADMWGNRVLEAAVAGSDGRIDDVLAVLESTAERLARSGQSGWPDMLIPVAVVAHRQGEDELARRWLRAVRDSDRPTQSFQVTTMFRRVRDAVGLADDTPLVDRTIEEVGADAMAWLRSQASV